MVSLRTDGSPAFGGGVPGAGAAGHDPAFDRFEQELSDFSKDLSDALAPYLTRLLRRCWA